ncbi:MAG: hypothetical protein JXA92_13470 [candidate division Zixibacteria bacterium]|nr:hypothetical protein [candidate division Zixibacteria bacterium]
MKITESITNAAYRSHGIVMGALGLGLIALAFFVSPAALQTASGLGGLGFISLGLAQVKRLRDEKRDEERFHQIMNRLEEIQKELRKSESAGGKGVVIADILNSTLKYYTENLRRPEDEEQKE